MYDKETDAVTNAVLALQAAGWVITDANGDGVEMEHPRAGENAAAIKIEFSY